jgi:4-hydroxy-tetrahydrodipicolinate synthase
MNTHPFTGTGVALVTPFKKDESIDFNALQKLIEFNIANGINYFVVLGTTGETATLSKEEKKEVYEFAVKAVNGKAKLVAGIGGNNTAEVVKQFENFNIKGYDAILSVSPYYNKPSQEGIYRHYMKLEAAAPLPIIIYNVPGRTASNITAETTLRLANASQKFIATKEASGIFPQIMQIVKHQPPHFRVISGDDIITLPMMSFGAIGVISVVGQAVPKKFSGMVNAALKNDFPSAAKLHLEMLDAMELFFAEGSPPGVKAALHSLGICENVLRLPMVNVSEGLYGKIKNSLN